MNKRMVAVVKMLSSTSDGEVVNAARTLGRMLEAAGLDWNDLGDYLARWPGMKAQAEPPPPRQESSASQQPGWKRRAGSGQIDMDVVGQQIIDLAKVTFNMRRADRDFIEQMEQRFEMYGSRTRVSEAQANWINDLHERFCVGRRR